MAANTFGHIIRLSSFGESHGTVTGGVIDGLPAGLLLDYAFIQRQLARRRPVSEEGGTDRQEEDQVSWLSGILDDKTTGAPLAFLVANNKHRSSDYSSLKEIYRPSHADYTWEMKYGMRDYRGGG
ncbi:MAG: chorismate synthase, partial [Bacteroidales bacterium]